MFERTRRFRARSAGAWTRPTRPPLPRLLRTNRLPRTRSAWTFARNVRQRPAIACWQWTSISRRSQRCVRPRRSARARRCSGTRGGSSRRRGRRPRRRRLSTRGGRGGWPNRCGSRWRSGSRRTNGCRRWRRSGLCGSWSTCRRRRWHLRNNFRGRRRNRRKCHRMSRRSCRFGDGHSRRARSRGLHWRRRYASLLRRCRRDRGL